MSLQHTNISRPGHFTYELLPCEATWDARVQVSVDYNETPDDDNLVDAEAWVRAPDAFIKAYMLTISVPKVSDRADFEGSIIKELGNSKEFADNMADYLSMVVDRGDRPKA